MIIFNQLFGSAENGTFILRNEDQHRNICRNAVDCCSRIKTQEWKHWPGR